MNNAFARIGRRVSAVVAGGLIAASLYAGTGSTINITLPHAVEVGSTVLPSGNYTLSSVEVSSGTKMFVVRPESGNPVTLQAHRIDADSSEQTRVEFNTEGDAWRFSKLFIGGESTGYEFVGSKVDAK